MTGLEIKKNRIILGWSQKELAEKVGLSRATIISYESGGVIPKTKSKIFDSVFTSYQKNEESNPEDEALLNKILDNNVSDINVSKPLSFIKTKNGLMYEELGNGKYRVKVPKVPFSAYSSFIEVFEDEYSNYENDEYSYFTVDHPGKGKYIAFTTKNDSMNGGMLDDTPSGAEVLGRMLGKQHWKDGIKPSQYGWIIVSFQGMMHKDIEGPDEEGKITCKSRNKSFEFPDFKLDLNEVHTIWKVIKRTF